MLFAFLPCGAKALMGELLVPQHKSMPRQQTVLVVIILFTATYLHALKETNKACLI